MKSVTELYENCNNSLPASLLSDKVEIYFLRKIFEPDILTQDTDLDVLRKVKK